MLSQLDREVHVDGSVQYLHAWPKAELLQLSMPSSFCHGEPTIVVMVTAKQPHVSSWLQQNSQNCGHGYSKHTQESTVQMPDIVTAAISALA